MGQLTVGVTVKDITAGYTSLAGGGNFCEAKTVVKILDADGNVLVDNSPSPKRIFSEQSACIMTKLLTEVTESGTASSMTLKNSFECAGKTGTTNSDCDRWFIGYTPDLLAGVWFGYPNPKSLDGFPLSPSPALKTFDNVMKIINSEEYLGYLPSEKFPVADGIVTAKYCKDSGKLVSSACLCDPRGCRTEIGYFTEDTPLCPHSPYSASKTSADMIVKAYHDTYHAPVTITRCSNNYGPYHFPEKLIPLIINNILEGKQLPVYGKGDNVRDWLYVEDHCKAIDLVVREGREGEVYNVGGHNEMTNIDIVKLTIKTIHDMMEGDKNLRNILKKQVKDANGDIDISWINDGLITFVADRLGHDQRYAIDPTKIKNELGWYPETMFADGIVKTIRWNLEHQDWVNEVTSGDYQKYYEQMYGNR